MKQNSSILTVATKAKTRTTIVTIAPTTRTTTASAVATARNSSDSNRSSKSTAQHQRQHDNANASTSSSSSSSYPITVMPLCPPFYPYPNLDIHTHQRALTVLLLRDICSVLSKYNIVGHSLVIWGRRASRVPLLLGVDVRIDSLRCESVSWEDGENYAMPTVLQFLYPLCYAPCSRTYWCWHWYWHGYWW